MIIEFYQNKRNPHKFQEIHIDEYGHYLVREVMKFDNGVINKVGDGKLHRWKLNNLRELLEDYDPDYDENWKVLIAECTTCGKHGSYVLSEEEEKGYEDYMDGVIYSMDGMMYSRPNRIYIQDALPKVPGWIRAGAIQNTMCFCPRCCR